MLAKRGMKNEKALTKLYQTWDECNAETIRQKVKAVRQQLVTLSELPPYIEKFNFSDIKRKLDKLGNALLQRFNEKSLVAFQATADGSCFYHSLSTTLYGNENYSLCLRTRTLLYMVDNFENVANFPPQNMEMSLKSRFPHYISNQHIDALVECSDVNGWTSSYNIYCATQALEIAIHVVYPPIRGLSDECYLSSPRFYCPQGRGEPKATVYVMWSSSIANTNEYKVKAFNHFLPVFNRHMHTRMPISSEPATVTITSNVGDTIVVDISASNVLSMKSSAESTLRITNKNNVFVNDGTIVAKAESPNKLDIAKTEAEEEEMEVEDVVGVEPYDASIDAADDLSVINKVCNHSHVLDEIPKCKKSECYFVVRLGNKNVKDGIDGWVRTRKTNSCYYDMNKNERVFYKNKVYYYRDGSRAPFDTILRYSKYYYHHKDCVSYCRTIYVIGDVSLIQYTKCEIEDENEMLVSDDEDITDNQFDRIQKFEMDQDIIKYVHEHPNKLTYIPEGNKSNSQFVIRMIGGSQKYKDDCGRWVRYQRLDFKYYDKSNGEAVVLEKGQYRYTIRNNGSRIRKPKTLPLNENVIRFRKLCYRHAKFNKFFRTIFIVGDNFLVQYDGKYKATGMTRLERQTILGNITVLKAAELILNSDLQNDQNSERLGGVFEYPPPQLTRCNWRNARSNTRYIFVTNQEGRYVATKSDALTDGTTTIGYSIYQCACNNKILRQVIRVNDRCLVQFFGEKPDACKCTSTYHDKFEVISANMKLTSTKILQRFPGMFKDKIQIKNIKAKILKSAYHDEDIENDMEAICNLEEEHVTSFRCLVNDSELLGHILFKDDTAKDMAGLLRRGGITLYIMTTDRICTVMTTMVCYVNTRLTNRNDSSDKPPMFIGPVMLHKNVNMAYYQEFFSQVKARLADEVKKFAPEDDNDIDSLITYVICYKTHKKELSLVTAVNEAFPGATRMRCGKKLVKEIVNHNILSKNVKAMLTRLTDSRDQDEFDQLLQPISTGKSGEEQQLIDSYALTILSHVCKPRWLLKLPEKFVDERELIDNPIRRGQNFQRAHPFRLLCTLQAFIDYQFIEIRKAFEGTGSYYIYDSPKFLGVDILFKMYMAAPRYLPNMGPPDSQLDDLMKLLNVRSDSTKDHEEFYGFD